MDGCAATPLRKNAKRTCTAIRPKLPDTVIFDEKEETIVDYVRPNETPEEAIKRLAEWGTALTPMHVDLAIERVELAFTTEPMEISEADWNYALNVLPPVAWKRNSNGGSFKMMERTTYSITAIYVLLNERYFSFQNTISLPHDECCRKVFESEAYRSTANHPQSIRDANDPGKENG